MPTSKKNVNSSGELILLLIREWTSLFCPSSHFHSLFLFILGKHCLVSTPPPVIPLPLKPTLLFLGIYVCWRQVVLGGGGSKPLIVRRKISHSPWTKKVQHSTLISLSLIAPLMILFQLFSLPLFLPVLNSYWSILPDNELKMLLPVCFIQIIQSQLEMLVGSFLPCGHSVL